MMRAGIRQWTPESIRRQRHQLERASASGSLYLAARDRVEGWLGGSLPPRDTLVRRWMGIALLPQAGVALGMALVASQRLPAVGEAILPVVVAATVLFEIIGPIASRIALERTVAAPSGAVASRGR